MTGCEIRLSRDAKKVSRWPLGTRSKRRVNSPRSPYAPPREQYNGWAQCARKVGRMGSSVGSWSWLTKVLKQKSKRGPRMNACPPNFPVRCFRFLWRSHPLNGAPSIVANARAVTRESVGSRRNNAKAWHLRVLNLLRDEFFFFSPPPLFVLVFVRQA